jgi:hypothetical protein
MNEKVQETLTKGSQDFDKSRVRCVTKDRKCEHRKAGVEMINPQ